MQTRDCEVGRYDSLTVLITGTRQNDYFPSRVWLDAVLVTTETHDGKMVRLRNFYIFAIQHSNNTLAFPLFL